METTKDKISNSNCLVSSKNTNWTVKKMYRNQKIPHLRTEIVIHTPIKEDGLDAFREMLFRQKLGEVLEQVNQEIEERLGEMLEADIESMTTSAHFLLNDSIK